MIRFKCPHCGKEISAGDDATGKRGRCPGCKELFQIPAVRAAKTAPAAERRTPPPPADDEDDAPPRKKPSADYEVVEDDEEAPPRRKPARDEEDEAPRKKKRPRDEDDDEAVAEAPRKKRPARDEEEDEEDDRPRRRRPRDEEEDEEDEPRARRRRGRDDEEDDEDEDDRPRRKKRRRRGPYADCPNCGSRGDATRVYYSFGWGFLPMFFSTVRCNRCGTEYNGKHGDYNLKRYLIYMAIVVPLALALGVVAAILDSK
jgi:hypothetical protein